MSYVPPSLALLLDSVNLNPELTKQQHQALPTGCLQNWKLALDSDFKIHHLAVIDALTEGDEDGLAKEQEILDAHDDEVASLTSRI